MCMEVSSSYRSKAFLFKMRPVAHDYHNLSLIQRVGPTHTSLVYLDPLPASNEKGGMAKTTEEKIDTCGGRVWSSSYAQLVSAHSANYPRTGDGDDIHDCTFSC